MDKIAIISDIHGNLQALEAVLEDIERRNISIIYCLGDLAGKGADGNLAIKLCQEKCQVIVRGNWDSMLGREENHPDSVWWQEELGDGQRQYLRELPNVYDFVMSGKRIRLYHASHVSEFHRIHIYKPVETHVEMFSNTDFTGYDNPEPDVVGYGDIHAAYMLSPFDTRKLLFNTGSVGNALDIPLATYVIMSGDLNSSEKEHVALDFVRLPYDVEGAIARAKRVDMPQWEAYAKELRTAIYRGRANT